MSETFLILIRIQRNFITSEHTASCKLPAIIVEFKLYQNFHERFSKNIPTSNSMNILEEGADKFNDKDW